MFLANKIIYAAQNTSARTWEIQTLAVRFARAGGDAATLEGMTPSGFYQTFGRVTAETSELKREITGLADLLPKIPRFELGESVSEAVVKMAQIDDETLLRAMPYARLPGSPMWLEVNVAIEDTPQKTSVGFLLSESGEGADRTIEVKCYRGNPNIKRKDIPFRNPSDDFTISREGVHRTVADRTLKARTREYKREFLTAISDAPFLYADPALITHENRGECERRIAENMDSLTEFKGSMLLSILLLLNSRSNIIKVDEKKPDPDVRQDKKQLYGKPLKNPVDLGAIVFDLDRVFQRNSAATPENARETLYTVLRSGHFKFRKTGVFWWSPHIARVTRAVGATPDGQTLQDTPTTGMPVIVKNRYVVKPRNGDFNFPEL